MLKLILYNFFKVYLEIDNLNMKLIYLHDQIHYFNTWKIYNTMNDYQNNLHVAEITFALESTILL